MKRRATNWKEFIGAQKKANINGKDAVIHVLETKNQIISIYGNTVLNDKIRFVPVGRLIKIVLTGLTNEDGKTTRISHCSNWWGVNYSKF